MEEIYSHKNKSLLIIYSIVLLMGAITPFNEIRRTILETNLQMVSEGTLQWQELDIEGNVFGFDNFSGVVDGNLFYEYFVRHN